jgi:hypothetical protein
MAGGNDLWWPSFNVCLNCSANRKFLILFMFLNNFEVLVIK